MGGLQYEWPFHGKGYKEGLRKSRLGFRYLEVAEEPSDTGGANSTQWMCARALCLQK